MVSSTVYFLASYKQDFFFFSIMVGSVATAYNNSVNATLSHVLYTYPTFSFTSSTLYFQSLAITGTPAEYAPMSVPAKPSPS